MRCSQWASKASQDGPVSGPGPSRGPCLPLTLPLCDHVLAWLAMKTMVSIRVPGVWAVVHDLAGAVLQELHACSVTRYDHIRSQQ